MQTIMADINEEDLLHKFEHTVAVCFPLAFLTKIEIITPVIIPVITILY